MRERRVRGEERMITGQITSAGAARKKSRTNSRKKRNEKKSGSLGKVGTRLKARKSSNENVKKMLRGKWDKKGREKEKEEEETFGISKKTPRSPIRKRKEGKDIEEEEVRSERKEWKEMPRALKKKREI